MVKTSLSFHEASFFLVRRPNLKDEIHPTRNHRKTKTLLDIRLLLPSRFPHVSPADLRKKDQVTSRLTRLFLYLQKHHIEIIYLIYSTRWMPDLRTLLLSMLHRLQILTYQVISTQHPGKLSASDSLQARPKQQERNQLHLLRMPALQNQKTSRHSFHNRSFDQLYHLYSLQVITRRFLLDQERSCLLLRLIKMISYHMILMIGSYNMQVMNEWV